RFELLCKNTLTFHPAPKAGIIEPASAHRADLIQNFLFSLRKMMSEPCLEQVFYGKWEPHRNIACPLRSRRGGCLENLRHLMIIQARDHRCCHYADRHSGIAQGLDCA